MFSVIFLILLLTPHAVMGIAWWFWLRAPLQRLPQWRRTLLLVGLLAGTLNVFTYWGWVVWLQMHYTTEAWKMHEHFWGIARCLIVATIAGGLCGKGRVQIAVCVAGILGFFLWVTTAVGV